MPIASVVVELSAFRFYVTHEWFLWLSNLFTPKLG